MLSSNPHVTVGKFGGGIAEAHTAFSVPKGVNIYGGTFRLGASDVADAATLKFTLDGGALAAAAGTDNALGALTVGENGGGIALGNPYTATGVSLAAKAAELFKLTGAERCAIAMNSTDGQGVAAIFENCN